MTSLIFAQNNNFKVSIEPEFGMLYGKITEFVYNATQKVTKTESIFTPTTKLSQLDWETNHLFYGGFTLNIETTKHFTIDLEFKTGFDQYTGNMEDYDWKNKLNPKELTNYSIHNNLLRNYTNLQTKIGYFFCFDNAFPVKIGAKAGLNTEQFDFSGIGGYRTYKDEGWKKIGFPNSPVIDYSQNIFCPNLEFYTSAIIHEKYEPSLSLSINFIDILDCLDHHRSDTKNIYYNDKIEKPLLFTGQLDFFYHLNKQNKIGLKTKINYIPKTYGLTYQGNSSIENISDTPMSTSLGGTERLIWDFSLSYSFTF